MPGMVERSVGARRALRDTDPDAIVFTDRPERFAEACPANESDASLLAPAPTLAIPRRQTPPGQERPLRHR